MPADQHGAVDRLEHSWRARWYTEDGGRGTKAGFRTRSEAREFLRHKVDEINTVRRGGPIQREMVTLGALCDEYLLQHQAESNTIATLTARLKKAGDAFGDVRLDRLTITELRAWRKTLPDRSAWHYVKALRQVLHYAVAVGLVNENLASKIPNPQPKRPEIPAFASVAELEAVAAELDPAYRAIPIVVGLTGLRPSEWLALERRDLEGDVVRIRRVFVDGAARDYGKQSGSLRTVPVPTRAALALSEHPTRVDTRLVFPSRLRAAPLDLPSWRRRHWDPALRAAGLEHRSPYALRHTFASFAIAAGVSLFELSRFMGTSVSQIDATYGHLLPDALDRTRTALDLFVNAAAEAAEGRR